MLSDLTENKLHVQPTRSGTTAFQQWRDANFSPEEALDPAISGFAANPDDDGLANIFEYLGGTSPREPSSAWLPSGELEDLTAAGLPGLWFTFRFRASPLIDDLRLLPQYSSDLINWSTSEPLYLRQRTLTPTLNEYVFRPPAPLAPANIRGFWRLQVIAQP